MNESPTFAREVITKTKEERLPTKLSIEAGIEQTRVAAYNRVGVLRDRVRMNTEIGSDIKSEILEQLSEIQKDLARGTLETDLALGKTIALAAEHNLQF